jgi:hypothetical protein
MTIGHGRPGDSRRWEKRYGRMDSVDVTLQILAAVEELNRHLPPQQYIPVGVGTSLLGEGGRLDSLGLVELLLLVSRSAGRSRRFLRRRLVGSCPVPSDAP